jgi:hypothetical protein
MQRSLALDKPRPDGRAHGVNDCRALPKSASRCRGVWLGLAEFGQERLNLGTHGSAILGAPVAYGKQE